MTDEKKTKTETNMAASDASEEARKLTDKVLGDPTLDKLLGVVKDAMVEMKDSLTGLVMAGMDEKAIGKSVNAITHISMELAKKAFAIGVQSGGEAMNKSWMTSLETVQKNFLKRTGGM